MPDLREDLGRLAGFAGEPVGLDDLAATRRRRERRRRTSGLAAGVAAIVAAAVFFATTLRDRPSTTPGTTPPSSGYVLPAVPYLWPQNWTIANDDRVLAYRLQLAADDDPSVQWQLDARQVVERFATDVLHWRGIDVVQRDRGEYREAWRISDGGTPCPTVVSCQRPVETVFIQQMPASLLWEVTSVESDALFLDTHPTGSSSSIALRPGDQVDVVGDVREPAFGVVARNGCAVVEGPKGTRSVTVPGMGSADLAGDCGTRGAGFVYAYTVDGPPSDSPFTEPRPIVDMILLPFVFDGGATPVPATPATAPDCASRTHVTVIEQDVTLVGCQDWAAGETIHLTYKSEDQGTYEGLELFLATECSAGSCAGKPIWNGDVAPRAPNQYSVYPIDPLPAGTYVLRDAVHPTTASLTIRVS